ncbi:MAG TPA: hypothetical protein VG245_02605 [Candidatus Dormibacteraeota bacterium]|nr:hypothetical protein [Candidatus Dormibacteraeota bacterium]
MLLALQGALILAGAVVLGFSASAIFPLDQVFGTDASVAAIVLGAALIMAFRAPTRSWVNLALLYEGLTIISGVWKYASNYGTHLNVTTMVISALFLIAFGVLYPRGDSPVHTTASA